jgi:hypothetical protein
MQSTPLELEAIQKHITINLFWMQVAGGEDNICNNEIEIIDKSCKAFGTDGKKEKPKTQQDTLVWWQF